VGRGIQTDRGRTESRVVRRLTLSYLAVFCGVILALSAIAFFFVDRTYRDVMEPALVTPEGGEVFASFERRTALSILSFDAALVLGVGVASLALARSAVRPLTLAREREARFAADVAHELRTPLGAIAGVAQAARGEAGPAERAAFETIARRALEAGTLVSDLLTLARSDGGDVLQLEPVDLAAIVSRGARDLGAAPPALELALQSAIVEGDERRLEQLTRNLLENARSHALSRVTVVLVAGDGWAELSVEDDGPGVPADVRPHLFERFAKGPESSGSGLGLAICRWVARSHGGDVLFDGGSRFTARIPLGRYPEAESPSQA
jgi:signal transduction histidine kinase